MKISVTQRDWDIPKIEHKMFNAKELEYMLNSFNRAHARNYYITDYCAKNFIIDSPDSLILCGYSKEIMKKDGFRFFNRILKQEELEWIMRMNAAAYEVFFRYPPSKRLKLIISYDLTVTTRYEGEFVLHLKVTPYKLCKNGNMWLALCYATISSSDKMGEKATIFSTVTGERYSLVGDKFVLSAANPITKHEIQILKMMVKGTLDENMASIMDIPISTFKRKKQGLYQKLGVRTSAEAVHKAHIEGII
jgi:DNA-binding CsgD family transcriptional regulator